MAGLLCILSIRDARCTVHTESEAKFTVVIHIASDARLAVHTLRQSQDVLYTHCVLTIIPGYCTHIVPDARLAVHT
jgi:hypothetical protein